MNEMTMTVNESKATKMVMHHEDGSVKEFTKGFIVSIVDPEPGETESTINLVGCDLSGEELIAAVFAVLAPFTSIMVEDKDDED